MDQARLQAKVAKGYNKAAVRIGAQATLYRPSSPLNAMSAAHSSFMAAFSADQKFKFSATASWGKPPVYGLFDTTDIQDADIVSCGGENYFVCRFEPFRPPTCMLCNHVVAVSGNPNSVSGVSGSGGVCSKVGYQPGYSSTGNDAVQTLGSGIPACIDIFAKNEASKSGVPGEAKVANYWIYLPRIAGLMVYPNMTIQDEMGRTYLVDGVDISQFGLKCLVRVVQV